MKPYLTRFLLPCLVAAALPAGEAPVSQTLNQFAAASYQELTPGHDNLILSPVNIATALSMAMAGAHGETRAQMEAVLRKGDASAGYDRAMSALEDQLSKAGNAAGNELRQANGLWVQRGFAIRPAFRETMENTYRAPLSLLDFASNVEQARSAINTWTAEQTRGKIAELLAPGSLGRSDRLVLTSAIYFKGKWQSAFRAQNTHPGPFRLGETGTVQVDFMNQKGSFGYAEIPGAQLLEMKYAGTPLAFDILLPRAPAGLSALEKHITADKVAGWLGTLTSAEVTVAIPKFRTDSEFSLKEHLTRMGMVNAFDNKLADFSGIDDKRDLYLSDVIHKAFVNVSEEGTEAAAATAARVATTAFVVRPAITFRADHPFAFLIRDTQSGVVLFEGRLAHPGA